MYEYMDVIPYKAGATITQMGENASWTGFILEGDLDVLVGDSKEESCNHKDGDMVGELASLKEAFALRTVLQALMESLPPSPLRLSKSCIIMTLNWPS